jgi:CubicO group peptidase (beta-lactamase class C family)
MSNKKGTPLKRAEQSFRLFATVALVILTLLAVAGCQSGPPDYTYTPPEDLGDGLEVGTIEEVGIDFNLIGTAVDRIWDGDFKAVHSLLIFKDGKLVVEEYFSGHRFSWEGSGYRGEWIEWDADEHHVSLSLTKSYVSAIVSIAIAQGFINSVHDSIFDYLPDHQRFAKDGKEDITIEHLVTMTSGLEWNEWNSKSGSKNSIMNVYKCSDQVACVLEEPLKHEPGTHFTYSGGNFLVLAQIVKHATGMEMDEYAGLHLYEPMGISELPLWVRYDSGMIDAAGGSLHTSRELLKLGVTYLNDGVWNGRQVIDEEWVALSGVPYKNNTGIKIPGDDAGRKGYGYTWWTFTVRHNGKKMNAYNAGGWGGQRIYVLPELDAVVVMTGGTYTANTATFTVLDKYILPAIE